MQSEEGFLRIFMSMVGLCCFSRARVQVVFPWCGDTADDCGGSEVAVLQQVVDVPVVVIDKGVSCCEHAVTSSGSCREVLSSGVRFSSVLRAFFSLHRAGRRDPGWRGRRKSDSQVTCHTI